MLGSISVDRKEYASNLVTLRIENKFLKSLSAGLVIANLALAYFVMTADTSEKTILVPPQFDKPMTFAGGELTPAYLEQMGRYFGNLLLTWHKANAMSQFEQVLNYVDPSIFSTLREQFAADFKRISRNDLSSVFFINGIDVKKNIVVIKGIQQLKVGSQVVSQGQKFYELTFGYPSGRLVITSYRELSIDHLNQLVPVVTEDKVLVEDKPIVEEQSSAELPAKEKGNN
jgi:conjugal transfer pilus assembly protein TraE